MAHMKGVVVASLSAVLVVIALVCAQIATAQSQDFIFLDVEDQTDAEHTEDANRPDVGAPPPDASVDDGAFRIQIDRLGGEPARAPVIEPTPHNDRRSIEAAVIERAKHCVATRTADPGDADVGFIYLVRAGRPHATLTAVTGDTGMHVSRLDVDILRILGDSRTISVRGRSKLFRECLEVVPLDPRPVVSERVGFRLKAGARSLIARDVEWFDL